MIILEGMETLTVFQPLFTAGIFLFSGLSFLVVFIALLLVGFNMILNAKISPLKKDIDRLEKGQANLSQQLQKIYEILLSNKKDK